MINPIVLLIVAILFGVISGWLSVYLWTKAYGKTYDKMDTYIVFMLAFAFSFIVLPGFAINYVVSKPIKYIIDHAVKSGLK